MSTVSDIILGRNGQICATSIFLDERFFLVSSKLQKGVQTYVLAHEDVFNEKSVISGNVYFDAVNTCPKKRNDHWKATAMWKKTKDSNVNKPQEEWLKVQDLYIYSDSIFQELKESVQETQKIKDKLTVVLGHEKYVIRQLVRSIPNLRTKVQETKSRNLIVSDLNEAFENCLVASKKYVISNYGDLRVFLFYHKEVFRITRSDYIHIRGKDISSYLESPLFIQKVQGSTDASKSVTNNGSGSSACVSAWSSRETLTSTASSVADLKEYVNPLENLIMATSVMDVNQRVEIPVNSEGKDYTGFSEGRIGNFKDQATQTLSTGQILSLEWYQN